MGDAGEGDDLEGDQVGSPLRVGTGGGGGGRQELEAPG